MLNFKNMIFCSILFLSLTTVFFAQTRETNLIINIKNQLGEVIPDAEITLLKSGKTEKLAKTNKQGMAQITRLVDGVYQLNIVAAGFSDYKNENIVVKKGEINKIEVILEVATVESKVIIGGDDEADTEKFGVTKVITEKEIEKLPDDPQRLERMLKKMAGESVTGEDMPISVDGVKDGKLPPKQDIQQIRVNQNVFSAQYEDIYGGGIEIFTRSGVDKFSGNVRFGFADSRFNASDPFLGKRVPFQSRNYSTYLSGPISKTTAFSFYGAHNESDSSAVINAIILNSSLQPVELKQSVATPNRSNYMYFNLKSDPNKKHKIGFSFNSSVERGKGQNVGGFSLASRATNSENQYHSIRFADTYLASDNVINQTLFSVSYSLNKTFGGSSEVAVNVLDAFFGGGSQTDSKNKSLYYELSNDTTWQMGKYALGFGWKFRGRRINQTSRNNFGGTYTFSGGIAPILNANNTPVTDGNGNILTTQISSLESYRRTLLFRGLGYTNSQIRALGGGANQFTLSGGNPTITANQYDAGLYIQNSYKITPTVAASFGVRYENQTNINSDLNFSPRFGVIWSPKAKEKQKPIYTLPKISVGFGVFYRRFDLSNFVSVKQSNDADRSQYLITDTSILDIYPNVPSIGLLEQFALPKSKRLIDPDIQTPFRSLFNINATKKIILGFSVRSTFSYTKNSRQTITRNINAPLAGTFNSQNPNSAVYPSGTKGAIYETFSTGTGENFRYSVGLNFPESEKLSANVNYSFTKAKNNIVTGSGSPFDPYNFSQEYAPTAIDGVHRVSGYFYYDLPYKFSVGSDFTINSGSRFNITTGRDTNGDGFYNERPSFATDLTKPNLIKTPYGVLDPNPSATDRLIPRNLARGPANFSFDGSLSKSIGFGEDKKNKKPAKRSLNFNLEVSNIFNIINKSSPIGNMSSPNFLKSLSNASQTYFDGDFYYFSGNESGGRSMNFSISFSF